MDENLVEYQQMLKTADAQMTKEIEDMTNGRQASTDDTFLHDIGSYFGVGGTRYRWVSI